MKKFEFIVPIWPFLKFSYLLKAEKLKNFPDLSRLDLFLLGICQGGSAFLLYRILLSL